MFLLQTTIALKELKKPLMFRPNSEESRAVLKQLPFAEAAIQSLLVHKNIVRTLWADGSAQVEVLQVQPSAPPGPAAKPQP